MNKANLLLVALLGVSSSAACNPSAGPPARSEILDSAGLKIIWSRGGRWGVGEAWTVSDRPALSIGALGGPEAYQFVAVSGAARLPDGDIVVVDRGAKTVRIFDSSGSFLKTLGGPGSGPGEFQEPGSVTLGRGNTLAIWDNLLFRMTRFDETGEPSDIQTLDLAQIAKAVEPPLYPGRVEPLPNGDFLVRLVEKGGKAFPSGVFRPRSGALRVAGDLSTIDTLMFFGDTARIAVDAPFGRYPVALPLAVGTLATHQGDPPKICIGDQTGPQVACFVQGEARTLIRWDPESRPVGEEEIADWREANLRLFGQKLRGEDILSMLDQVPLPTVAPEYSQIILDRGMNLWVKLGPTPRSGSFSFDYLVFDPSGLLLGMVVLPPVTVLEIGDDYFLGLFRDEFEVEYVQLYEISKPSGGMD